MNAQEATSATIEATERSLRTGPLGRPLAMVLAAAVSTAFLVCVPVDRLPTLGWVAVFLFFAMESDLRSLRIPNALNLVGGLAALAIAFVHGGPAAAAWALAAAGLTFALLFPLFAWRILGAGDVKALMVLAAFLGAAALPGLLWWSAVCGGVIGLAWIALRGGALDLARRWGRSLVILVCSQRWLYVPPAPSSAAAQGIPFAVAIGAGATALQIWGTPWA